MEKTTTNFIFFSSKINKDGECHHKMKKQLLLGRIAKTNDSVLKSRDITLPTKVCLVKTMVSPVTMYGCEIWTIKKVEHWVLMLLNCGAGEDSRVPWTERRSNQSVLNIHWKDWCWNTEAPITWPPDVKRWLIGKDPDAGGNWGQKKRATEDEMAGWHHWHDGHEFEQDSGEWGRTGKAGMLQSMGSQRVGHDLAIEWQKSDISDYVICHLFITPSLLSFLIKDADSVSNYSPTICPYF